MPPDAQGYDFHLRAQRVDIQEAPPISELYEHVRRAMGPIAVRGVWYPCFNVGFGAPRR